MPCNARSVVEATVNIPNISSMKDRAKAQGWQIIDRPGGYDIIMGYRLVIVEVRGDKAVLKSFASDWDTGVNQLRKAMSLLTDKLDAEWSGVGQPETHVHDHAAPLQRRKVGQ